MPGADDSLGRLRAAVLADPELQRRLLAVADRREFAILVACVAREQGLHVDPREVEEAITECRRAWYSTWI